MRAPPYLADRWYHAHGFALPAVILLCPLFVLLGLASVQLQTVHQQDSKCAIAQSIARQNAKFALQIAIAQLQHYAGRDQTVSCRSDILTSNRHQYFTTIYQTEETQGSFGNGITIRKAADCPAVLVSGNENFDLLKRHGSYPDQYFHADSRADGRAMVTLNSHYQVEVPLVQLNESSSTASGYAYWVIDEGLKARVNVDSPAPDASQEKLLDAVRAPAFTNLHELKPRVPHDDYIAKESQFTTPASLAASGLFKASESDELQHDITTYSQFLLCDSLHGGLKKNLSAAFQLENPGFFDLIHHAGEEYQHPNPVFLYQRWSFPGERDELSISHYPGGPWELFRSYFQRPQLETSLSDTSTLALSHLGSKAHQLPNYWEHSEERYIPQTSARLVRRSPVITRFQVSIDYTIEDLGEEIDPVTHEAWHRYRLRQHFIPYVSFWNPYNRDLLVSDKVQFKIYLKRGFSGGSYASELRFNFSPTQDWKMKKVTENQWHEGSGPVETQYPYYETTGKVPTSNQLNSCSFTIPSFVITAGEACSFSSPQTHQPFAVLGSSPNKLVRLNQPHSLAHSYFTKNLEFKTQGSLPSITLLRFPAEGGDKETRLQITNASSFQRLYWNFGESTANAQLTFTPTVIHDSEAIPTDSALGSSSPKFTAILCKKWPKTNPRFGAGKTHSQKLTASSNEYQAPWALFYHHNAARYGALGSEQTFASSPYYQSGVILGQSALHLPEQNHQGRPFVGYSDTSAGGSLTAQQYELPDKQLRMSSVAHLSRINLSKWLSNYNAQQSNASSTDATTPSVSIANSFAPPHIPLNTSHVEVIDAHAYDSSNTATHYDHSFRYNHGLWDRYFFTGIHSHEISTQEQLDDGLPVEHLKPITKARINDMLDPHRSASQLMLESGFNINSTSVRAWQLILSAAQGIGPSGMRSTDQYLSHFSSFNSANSKPLSHAPTQVDASNLYDGSTHRALRADEILKLATAIVEQNKRRGPAASLSQFINRSLSPANLASSHGQHLSAEDVCYSGRLQAAIDSSNINGSFNQSNCHTPSSLIAEATNKNDFAAGKVNPHCLQHHSGYGAPATITQADLLYRIGHRLSPRSDTFRIRGYGECRDSNGRLLAKAYAECIVQRRYQYADHQDATDAHEKQWKLSRYDRVPTQGSWIESKQLSSISKKFGRRYEVVSFRWLHPREI